MVVFTCSYLLGQVMKLKILRLEIQLRSHQIIPISLICLREFNLIYLVFNHEFASKDVVKRTNVCMLRGKCACTLEQTVFFIVGVLCSTLSC
jgi:hypothetical protein